MIFSTAGNIENFHIPVLVDEVVEYLITDPGGIYLDCMVGGGGHAAAILKNLNSEGLYYGIDRDSEAIDYAEKRLEKYRDQVILIQGELAEIDTILTNAGVNQVQGVLMDLGISSHQLDTPERGFSYRYDGPLDMRMDIGQDLTAEYVINYYSEKELADIFYYYGEERYSRKIAGFIAAERKKNRISTSGELVSILEKIIPRKYRIKTFSRIWQSLRLEVNRELAQLKAGLNKIYDLLQEDGRMVVITWESLSDRMIKRYFKGQSLKFTKFSETEQTTRFNFKILTKKVVRPGQDEIRKNPRAKSAKLRAAIKIKER